MDLVLLSANLTSDESAAYMAQFNQVEKSAVAGVLLALFLGGLGAHRFYMGQTGLGLLYLLFCWTFVPTIVAFVEIFLMPGRVQGHNAAKTAEIVTSIKASRTGRGNE